MFGKSAKRFWPSPDRRIEAMLRTAGLFCVRASVLGLAILAFAVCLRPQVFPPQLAEHFQLGEIHLEGLKYLEQPSLERMLRENTPTSLLAVDLDRLRQLVESESWVAEAIVRRRLPNQLVIQVTEREPSAVAKIDSELFLVDAQGSLLDRPGPRHGLVEGPVVKGLKNVARENARQDNALRMELYLKVLEELAPYNDSISEIDVGMPEQVIVTPQEEPILIYLGDRRFRARYETFVAQKELYQKLKKEYGEIESVDVTFDDKIIFHTLEEQVTTQPINPS